MRLHCQDRARAGAWEIHSSPHTCLALHARVRKAEKSHFNFEYLVQALLNDLVAEIWSRSEVEARGRGTRPRFLYVVVEVARGSRSRTRFGRGLAVQVKSSNLYRNEKRKSDSDAMKVRLCTDIRTIAARAASVTCQSGHATHRAIARHTTVDN